MPHVDLDEFGSRLVGEAFLDAVLQFGVVESQSSCNLVDGIEWCKVNGGLPQILGNRLRGLRALRHWAKIADTSCKRGCLPIGYSAFIGCPPLS